MDKPIVWKSYDGRLDMCKSCKHGVLTCEASLNHLEFFVKDRTDPRSPVNIVQCDAYEPEGERSALIVESNFDIDLE